MNADEIIQQGITFTESAATAGRKVFREATARCALFYCLEEVAQTKSDLCNQHWRQVPRNLRVQFDEGLVEADLLHGVLYAFAETHPFPLQVWRVLSLRQPWASLVVHGLKRFETRSRAHRTGGRVLIHAAANPSDAKAVWLGSLPQFGQYERQKSYRRMVGVLAGVGYQSAADLPYGSIIGAVTLGACHETGSASLHLSTDEQYFGNYAPGRFAIECSAPVLAPSPIPAVGALGLWKWAGDLPWAVAP